MKFTIKLIHHLIISVLLFTIWAAFALLIINKNTPSQLPEYIMGSICIWDYGAMILSIFCSFVISKYWGYPKLIPIDQKLSLGFPLYYGYFFLGYFIFSISIAIWQFWLFSQQF